jgi:KTSC domain-containing protein
VHRVAVESSVIDSVGYEDKVLEVRFSNGGLYRYFGVPPEVCFDLLKADSIGRFFNDRIRGSYSCKRLKRGHPDYVPTA